MPRTLDRTIAFVETLETGDRNADLDIAVATRAMLYRDEPAGASFFNSADPEPRVAFMSGPSSTDGWRTPQWCPRYTASTDACHDLMEAVAPGWIVSHAGDNGGGVPGNIRYWGHTVELSDEIETVQGNAPTRALAFCLAVLKAAKSIREANAAAVVGAVASSGNTRAASERSDIRGLAECFAWPVKAPEVMDESGTFVAALRWRDEAGGELYVRFDDTGAALCELERDGVRLATAASDVGRWFYFLDALNTDDAYAVTRKYPAEKAS